MKHYDVSAAIIINDGKILCVQRDSKKFDYISMRYEFPGGKIELGESKEVAGKREINEELNLDIEVVEEFLTVIHQYPDFKITMYSFICACKDVSTLNLKEHLNFEWLDKSNLKHLDWAAADLPIVEKLAGLEI